MDVQLPAVIPNGTEIMRLSVRISDLHINECDARQLFPTGKQSVSYGTDLVNKSRHIITSANNLLFESKVQK